MGTPSELLSPKGTLPSRIILNAGEAATDPVDELAKLLVFDEESLKPRAQVDGAFHGGSVEDAIKAMTNVLEQLKHLEAGQPMRALKHRQPHKLAERYLAAQRTAFGSGPSRPYSEAWHKRFGLLTDADLYLILRLNEAQDRAAFTEHFYNDRAKILSPGGASSHAGGAQRAITISGSLTHNLCDENLVRESINLGLPVLFLPHVAVNPLTISNQRGLVGLARDISRHASETSSWSISQWRD